MKENITMEDFAYLLLGTLATKPQIIDLNDRNKKIVSLPSNYKQRIQNILCAENRWKEMFSGLINIEEYFDDHFAWEIKLANTLKKVIEEMNKKVEYDYQRDSLIITFTEEEIESILNKYESEELKNSMDHFTNLLIDYIYSREFQEHHYDYYAHSVKKIHDLYESEIEDPVVNEINKQKTKTFPLIRGTKRK